jgi:hypothetical protein
MKNTTRWATLILSVAGLGIFSAIPSVAESTTQPSGQSSGQSSQNGDAAANCTINGTVTKDGKPLPNAKVALFVAREHAKVGKKGGAASANADNNNSATTQPSADNTANGAADGEKKKHDRGDATATATADENGAFTLTNVPAGDYVVIAGLKGDGRGHERVTVTSGGSTSVEIPVSVPGEKTKGGKKLGKLGI